MKLYVDTTVLAAYYLPGPSSGEAEEMLRAFPQPAVSPLAEVELAAWLAAQVAEGELAAEAMGRVLDVFDDQLAAGYFDRVALDARAFERARRWIERTAPRSGAAVPLTAAQALHLAAAGHAGRHLLTGDRRLAEAAGVAGVPVVILGSEPAPGQLVQEAAAGYDAGFEAPAAR